ncbi:MepB family protein [Pseudomonas fragi]|uniref:MepB family protein n=1 Tax=Pseudomonas fragi TaxID=296 RepID=UPI0028E5FE0E|nr:MepB family protein [Pseudomonas fragi]
METACPGGEITPLDSADDIDFVVVHVSSEGQCGQFIFDRETLLSRGVFAINGRGGKRALRVYPPWSQPAARQAVQSQKMANRVFCGDDSMGTGLNIASSRPFPLRVALVLYALLI